ncbi:MAG: ATP-binding protein [Treponema sp.]|nr:ATP-binding protein [Treponema sp.]
MKKSKNKLSVRFRNINLLFIVCILLTIMAVSAVMIFSLASSASKSNVNSYTMETVYILASYLNREITLVRQAVETREIREWFADEENPEKKAAAYQRMMHYADLLQINSVYFVILDSLDEYSVSSGASFEEFIPFDVLDRESLYDQWFFEAVNSDFDFTLNLDIDKVTDTRRIWINYKVMNNGYPLGIFCSALQFDDVFIDLFNKYDRQNIISYIIDEKGIIQISSYVPEPDLMHTDYTIHDIDEGISILSINSNADFTAAINRHLENPAVHFKLRVETDIIRLSHGKYRYMSVASIPGTSWFTVTFFSSDAVFDATSILIPIAIVVLAFIIYVATSSLLIQKLVFKPLHLFTKSVSDAFRGNADIYGFNRDDEIGDLARTAMHTWSRIEKNSAALKRRDKLLEAVNTAANILLSSEIELFKYNLHHCMGLIASAIDVSRVRLWKNYTENDQLYCTQLYEWYHDVEPQQGTKYTINIPYNENIPGWEKTLSGGECINSIVREMSPAEQAQLSPQGILSLMVVPVFINDQFWGFMSYVSCNSERLFEKSEETILRSGSLLIANALVRHDMTQNLRDTVAKLEDARNEAETASRSKSVFLANMSHEIRTPMNAILGVTEILIQNETLSGEIEEGLERIYSSCDMLLGIINDILDFSKIEAGKIDIIHAQYKVASLLNDSAQLNMMRINGKPIEFELHVDESIPAKLIGDEIRIKQILNNLLSNAFKYTDSGKVILSAHSEPSPDVNGIILVLGVRDTGYGMTEEQLGKLYNEYSRFSEGNRRTVEGTGLGLAITHRLIRLMNGEIYAESKPGVGSYFSVWLPQETVDDEELGAEIAENLKQFRLSYITHKQRGQVKRDPMPYGSVLIVDDVETNLYVAAGLMKLYRLQIDTVMSGREAIEKIENGKAYDVVFMDHMMPEMDGIETTRRIREWEAKQNIQKENCIPVVALTANAVAGQADIFLQNGFDDFISKPIDIRQLNSVLNRYVRDKQSPEVIEAALAQIGSGLTSYSNGQTDTMLFESFVRDARKALVVLEELVNLTEHDLQKFTVTVHGMKSSLWNINETALSELAHELELAARNKSIDFIKESAPEFLLGLNKLLEKYELEHEANISGEDGDIDDLQNKLHVIRKMCGDYDRKGVLDSIFDIKKGSATTMAVLEKIKEHVMHSGFDEAERIAADYLIELSR